MLQNCLTCGKEITKGNARKFCSYLCRLPKIQKYNRERNKGQGRKEKQRERFVSDKYREWRRNIGRERRLKCIQHYSAGKGCACCGETSYEFLAIDHIDGGGNDHRKKIKSRGGSMVNFLIRENFPSGFRILCHNCNMALGIYKYCPHNS